MPFIILTIILFSSIEVAIKLLFEGYGVVIDPILLAVIRFSVAGIALAFLSLSSLREITRRDMGILFLLGTIGVAGSFGPFHTALEIPSMRPQTAALLFSLNPLFAALFAAALFKEQLNLRYFGGIFFGFLGVYLVIFGFSSWRIASLEGPLLILWSALTFGLYTTVSKKYVARYGARAVTACTFLAGSIVLLPFVNSWNLPLSTPSILIVGYLTIGATFVGYLSYFHGLKKVSIKAGSSLFFVKPLLATLFTVMVFPSEPLTNSFYIGMILILGALSLTLSKGPVHETR